MRFRFMIRYAIVLFGILLVAAPAIADEEDLGSGAERHLNGHGFLPSQFVGDPFVSSTFQNLTGGGMASNLNTTVLDLAGNELFTLEGSLIYASLGLGYQQKLWSRFTVGASVAALVRTGTNLDSFLMEGADVDRNGAFWAGYRLHRGERSQVYVGLDWSYSKTIYFTPYEFAQHVGNGGPLETAPLVVNSKIWTTRVAINWAHAFSRTYGIRASGAFGLYEVPETSGVTKGSHRIGVLGEMDLQGIWPKVPVGVTLGYTQNLPDDDPYTGSSGLLAGIWYTGKQEFVVGVETGFMKTPLFSQDFDKVDTFFGMITIRYYF